ncbi:hypothetical protein [Photobacterium frigidiphilum]|uniref:hypothetical protein n=1 Tax=Photobacterium frigidiphilum TaxID=264736 RepID=UPI0014732BD2|nr:hypothetical protein [Photobacterium frigidiphilum]
MNKFLDIIVLQGKYLVDNLTSVIGYTLLFKGGIALITVGLISIQYVATTAIPIEASAYQLKYEVEFSVQKQYKSISDMECDVKIESYSKCMLSKYKENLSTSSIKALYSWLELLIVFGTLMMSLSVLGFLAHPYFHQDSET